MKVKTLRILVLLPLLAATAAFSQTTQTIKGAVLDRVTKQPLVGATVKVADIQPLMGATAGWNFSGRSGPARLCR